VVNPNMVEGTDLKNMPDCSRRGRISIRRQRIISDPLRKNKIKRRTIVKEAIWHEENAKRLIASIW
jgi:hypothetical protein